MIETTGVEDNILWALSDKWETASAIAERTGFSQRLARERLQSLRGRGLVERRMTPFYMHTRETYWWRKAQEGGR